MDFEFKMMSFVLKTMHFAIFPGVGTPDDAENVHGCVEIDQIQPKMVLKMVLGAR